MGISQAPQQPQRQAVTTKGTEQVPTLRQGPEDDGNDHLRIKLVTDRWSAQDSNLIRRDRAVEARCRVLMGDMWTVWVEALGKAVDLADALGTSELLWRELPAVNLCQQWFGLTMARMTENTPVLGAEPRDSDHESIQLADACDVLLPKVWDDMQMTERTFEMVAWMAAAGWTFAKYGAETASGTVVPMVGPAMLPAPDGSQVPVEHAAFDTQGNPLGRIVPSEAGTGWGYELDDSEQPGQMTEGSLTCRIPNPLAVRGEWGSNIPWQQKRWHIHHDFLDPTECEKRWGVVLQPDTTASSSGSGIAHYQMRLDRGAGHFGASDAQPASRGLYGTGPLTELCAIWEMWERPSSDFPEGRLLIVSHDKVLFDGPRPFPKLKDYGYTSPITFVPWLQQPGQPFGATPLSDGMPINRQYNALYRKLMLHSAKVSNPVLVYNTAIMDDETAEGFARPGFILGAEFNPATGQQPPAFFISPAAISADVYKTLDRLREDFNSIMGLAGAEGVAQGSDASGEQVKELRFNSDRPISVPVKNLASGLEEGGNIAFCILPVIWPMEKLIHYMGDDNLGKTMTLLPDMWNGQCRVRIDAESMLPRSRQEREQQALQRYQLQLYGLPGSPDAIRRYNEQSGYPDRDKASTPGAVDRDTCNHLIGMVMQGMPAMQIEMLEQYNYGVMKDALREHMASQNFLKEDRPVQAQMQVLWQRLTQAEQVQAMMQAKQQAQVQGGMMQIAAPLALAQAHVQGAAAQIAAPPPPPDAPTANSSSGE